MSYEQQRPLAIPQYPFFLSPTPEEHCGVVVATGVRGKKYIFQLSLQVSRIKQGSSQWYMSRSYNCNFQLA